MSQHVPFTPLFSNKPLTVALADFETSQAKTIQLGTPAPDRFVLVSSFFGISSVSIAGIVANQIAGNGVGGDTFQWWLANVPNGTSGLLSFAGVEPAWAAYIITGKPSLFSNNFTGGATTGAWALSLPAKKGGCILAAGHGRQGGAISWSGLTKNADDTYSFDGDSGISETLSNASNLVLADTNSFPFTFICPVSGGGTGAFTLSAISLQP